MQSETIKLDPEVAVLAGKIDFSPDALLNKYLSENKLKMKPPSIELYNKGPMDEADSSKWQTRIIYIVE